MKEVSSNNTILFVDDEQNILNSIKRTLMGSPYKIFTALSAKEGLEIMANEEISLVISDFRMPGMDGIQFLKIVKEKYPEVMRIILSGFLDKKTALSSLSFGLSMIYFTKPWDNKQLKNRLKHSLHIRKILKKNNILKPLNSIDTLPILSSVYYELLSALDEQNQPEKIEEIMLKDSSLCIKILQVINSAFFGKKNIVNLKEAVSELGANTLKELLIQFDIKDEKTMDKEIVTELKELYLKGNIINKYLPVFYKIKYGKTETIPCIGITYQAGKLIFLHYFPEYYIQVKNNIPNLKNPSFYGSEKILKLKNLFHNELGAYFLDLFNFPNIFIESTLFYVNPGHTSIENKSLTYALYFLDKLVSYISNTENDSEIDYKFLESGSWNNSKIKEIASNIKIDIDKAKELIH